jgi:hypothetical protein
MGVSAEMRRSMMHLDIARLLDEGAIAANELEDFSDGMKEDASFQQKDFEKPQVNKQPRKQ